MDTPFELLKKDINDTFAGLSFDVNALPVPEQNTVTFCDQMDTSVVDDLGRDLVKAVKIGIVIMIILIFVLIAANCALAGVGYVLVLTVLDNMHVRYFAIFCITSGTYTTIGVVIAWCTLFGRVSVRHMCARADTALAHSLTQPRLGDQEGDGYTIVHGDRAVRQCSGIASLPPDGRPSLYV